MRFRPRTRASIPFLRIKIVFLGRPYQFWESKKFFEMNPNPVDWVTPVAGSIFGPISQTHFSKREFKTEISSSTLLDIQMTLLCVCGVNLFIPELEHLIEKKIYSLFSKKKPLKSNSWIQIDEIFLRSTSSAENFPRRLL